MTPGETAVAPDGADGARASKVLAPNPGPMTLQGTNSWVIAAPGGRSVVLDCGPDDASHLLAVAERARAGEREVGAVLVTHHHLDHAEGLASFSARTGVPLTPVADGDVIRVDGLTLHVLGTPGHTADSVTFLDRDEGCLYTGDTLLGEGTTVVAHPDGRLGDYLDSLRRLAGVEATRIRPGHGPDVTDVAGWIAYYRSHRAQRLDQVRDAVAAGAVTAQAVVELVYADV
ncbi:MAG TPA: MBL fold metallo-hydrolase, partial [Mycobacteriales bacterium]|nr:MBL fold metallo-hydrolase [Mycobacteriales bacterium]